MRRPQRALGAAAALVLALLAALVPTTSAGAATTAGWAAWEPLAGSAGSWSTTMRLPAGGFPAATVTSDSRGGQVGVQTGQSSWLSTATPPGAVFGSSQGQAYLNLRPRADTPTAPSTTTYTFERPTPAGGWAFVLGDIDADGAVVVARGTDGGLLTGAELGWQGGFNYCAVSPGPSCTGDAGDVATWDPVTGQVLGNAAGVDTSGASGWFRPTVPVTSLTVLFAQRTGFPVYQTWFASLARDVSGVVDLVDGDGAATGVVAGATLTLRGPDGTVLATTTSGDDGSYAFPGYAAAPGYAVELTALPAAVDAFPFGLVPSGPRVVTGVDLSSADAGIDLAAREVVPIAVSGTVRDVDGVPVPGVTVTLTPVGGGTPVTATTSARGEFVLDDVGWDVEGGLPQEWEFALADLPDGYTVESLPANVTVDVGQEAPSTGNDAVVAAPPSLSGTVTAGGAPVAGAVVTVTGPGGTRTVPTAADGTYAVDGLVPGEHTVGVEVPFGYTPDGPTARTVTVDADDVADVDFALARPGAVGGVVTDAGGAPVPGATVTVDGPDGAVELVTDADGAYFLDGLVPGAYAVALTVPDGYTASTTERAVTLTAAGENRLDQDFAVAQDAGPVAVSGTVTDEEGYSVPGARVDVRDADGDVVATSTVGDGGTWSADLPPGAYTARVTPPDGYVPAGDGERTFEVVDAPLDGIDFVLFLADDGGTPGPTDPTDPDPGATDGGTTGGGTTGGGTTGGSGTAGGLASTGATTSAVLASAAALVLLGGVLAATARRAASARAAGSRRVG